MARIRHLCHAPIVEAVLDLRIVPLPQGRYATLRPTGHAFEKVEDVWTIEGPVSVGSTMEPVTTGTRQQVGYKCTWEGGRHVALFRVDGFTFSRLAPYTTWDTVRAEAVALWQEYQALAGSPSVTRAALRYINRFALPGPVADLSAYLLRPPAAAEGVAGPITSFVTRVISHDETSGADVAVAQLSEQAQERNRLSLILDVDVFRLFDPPVAGDEAWSHFPTIHDAKNRAFFGSITEQTAEMFA